MINEVEAHLKNDQKAAVKKDAARKLVKAAKRYTKAYKKLRKAKNPKEKKKAIKRFKRAEEKRKVHRKKVIELTREQNNEANN